MRVVVVGGGIGGLALAHGLTLRGIHTDVLERDTDFTLTGGYKLHLGPMAVRALHQLLPPERMARLRAASVRTDAFELAVRTHRGQLLLTAGEVESGESLDIDRITLRRILAEGLEPHLLTDRTATSYDLTGDHVSIRTRPGHVHHADVLVIADGAHSTLIQQLSGGITNRPTGLVGIAGRTSTSALTHTSQDLLRERPSLAVGAGGVGLFTSWHAPQSSYDRTGLTEGPPEPMVIWGMIATEEQLPSDFRNLPSPHLAELAAELLGRRRWLRDLQQLPQRSNPQSVGAFRFLAADPLNVATWAPGPVTALGDAAHAMPPTGGQGAATAIRDAAHLTAELARAADGEVTITEAAASFQRTMLGYAPQAVRDSLEPVRWIKASAHPVARVALTGLLPAAGYLSATVRRFRR